jgi:hypothetical protein
MVKVYLIDCNKQKIEKVINGEHSQIYYSLNWLESPQGYSHWHDICYEGKNVSAKDIKYLKFLLACEKLPTKAEYVYLSNTAAKLIGVIT